MGTDSGMHWEKNVIILYNHVSSDRETAQKCEPPSELTTDATGCTAKVRFSERVEDFGAHPAFYTTATGESFPGDKKARAWSWPLISIWGRG
jgi:hypothetical protein